MLKPKRKITRKELKRDPLLETLYRAQQNWQQHQRRYLRVAIAIVAVVVVVLFLNQRRQGTDREASARFGQALVYLDVGDRENALLQLETLRDEYGQTRSGQLAQYYLGQIFYEQGEYQTAQTYFKDFTDRKAIPLLTTSALRILADIAVRAGNYDAAVTHLKKAVKVSRGGEARTRAQLALAEVLTTRGDWDEAQDIVDEMIALQDLPGELKKGAEELSGRLFIARWSE